MKQQAITLLLIMLMSMVGAKSLAHDIEAKNEDGVTIYYVWKNNRTELSVSYQGTSYSSSTYTGNVVIPESVNYEGGIYPVTSIGYSAFNGCKSLTSVTIPSGVTSIDNSAFQDCSNLISVTIPEGVTRIGTSAFDCCHKLYSMDIPNSVETIGDYAFYACGLLALNIGYGLINIGENTFEYCNTLTSISVHEDNTTYDSRIVFRVL